MAYESTYSVARVVAQCISSVGWLLLASTIIVGVSAMASSERPDHFTGIALLSMLLGGLMSSALLIASGQITRAIVDVADSNGEILAILKSGIRVGSVTDAKPEREF